ncbi:cytochrome P450 [Lophiostoma macrostomum CBS 122681]|uniref:Cytochrome P450 n=1 Tax=Lophiostoma macrostomum CBS 122681 TaxID=1314788 RepID=A0A6A6T8S6_9PLEO|nr:cytochrome P450 [Lophiostoma macrostomum CBS 122681]
MFIQAWSEASGLDSTAIATAFVAVSLLVTFATLKRNRNDEIHTVQNGKIIKYDTVLVGAPNEKTWSWLVEMKAKFQYFGEGYHLMYAAFKEHSGRILRAPLADYKFYILPPQYMEELKSLPPAVMSSSVSVQEYLLGQYTTMNAHTMMGDVTWSVLRNHLTQKLGTLVEPLNATCKAAFQDEFPDCTDWTEVNVHDTFLQIVGRMTGRIFVGEEMSKNKLFLHTFIDFATCVFITSSYLKVFPSFLRPLLVPLIPHFWRIKKIHYNNRKLLLPEVRKKLQESSKEAQARKQAGEQDMLDWLIEASGSKPDPQNVITRQLGIGFAAIHTTTNHMTNVLYDLAAWWDEYAPPLIAEYRQALAEDGGVMQKSTLSRLSKLDSFMKESQRLNPSSSLAFNRKVLKDCTLSDGKVLPKSCWIAVASGPLLLTQSQFENPLEFDGFRFDRMRQEGSPESQTEAAKMSHFTSTGKYSLVFGHGRYACPGRFFAGLESKIMLIHVLENYELRLPEGATRYENLVYADANIPDPTKHVVFRKLIK